MRRIVAESTCVAIRLGMASMSPIDPESAARSRAAQIAIDSRTSPGGLTDGSARVAQQFDCLIGVDARQNCVRLRTVHPYPRDPQPTPSLTQYTNNLPLPRASGECLEQ
jgi:hypothetical protein